MATTRPPSPQNYYSTFSGRQRFSNTHKFSSWGAISARPPRQMEGIRNPLILAATLPSGHRNRPRSGLGPGEPSWIDDHRQGCLSATAIWRVLKRESRFWNHPPLHGRARAQSYQSTTDGEILRQLFPRLSADLCHVALDRSKVGAGLPRPWYPVRSRGQHAHRRRAASGNNATLSPLPPDFG